jgi:hypothetical protein
MGAIPAVYFFGHVEMVDSVMARIAFTGYGLGDVTEGGHNSPPDT